MTGSNENLNAKPAPEHEASVLAGQANAKAAQAKRDAGGAVAAGKDAAERAAEATTALARAVPQGLESGRQALVAVSGQVAASARTAASAMTQRRLVAAAGTCAGLTLLGAASYTMGRKAERRGNGPLTRLVGGRI